MILKHEYQKKAIDSGKQKHKKRKAQQSQINNQYLPYNYIVYSASFFLSQWCIDTTRLNRTP